MTPRDWLGHVGGVAGLRRELRARAELVPATGIAHAAKRVALDLRHARGNTAYREVAEEIWAAAAREIGAVFTPLGNGFFELTRGGVRTRVVEQTPPLNDVVSVLSAENKALVYRLLERDGLSVPEHVEVDARRIGVAVEFLERVDPPYLVKPAIDSSRGFGVTARLQTAADVRRACRWAARFADRLLIERQVPGDVYRVLVLDGEVIDIVRSGPPTVTGDGHSTIAELVAAEYARRIETRGMTGIRPLTLDLDSVLTLREAGLSPRSVPAEDEAVRVKTVTNQNRRDDNVALQEPFPIGLSDAAVRAARALGLRLAGVDVVTPDPEPQLHGVGAIIDVNARPGLWHHYDVRDGTRRDVAVAILERIL